MPSSPLLRVALLSFLLLFNPGAAQAAGPSASPAKALEAPPEIPVVVFYTRPLVKARLRIPDSLQNYTVTAIAPLADDPGRFDVEVHFEARTPFGGTTAHRARFQMKRAAVEGEWIVTAR
ncbi:hypothetical protein [Stagnimonas aquatica]|uniref:hypothetical protein n=1 Tax=Stagnimonas aquatica TaxID=2689987 RepID=UPI0011CDCB12|nr:hypothetical protein [Stagnimonas aquatica]